MWWGWDYIHEVSVGGRGGGGYGGGWDYNHRMVLTVSV